MLRVCVFLRLPYISAAQLRLGACAEGHIDRAVLLSAMMLCNFVRLYISEALVALNVARFVIVSPMSSRTFAERFLPHLSDYG